MEVRSALTRLGYPIAEASTGNEALDLAFREAPSLDIAKVLIAAGAEVRGYDPAAMENMQRLVPDMEYCKDAYAVAAGAGRYRTNRHRKSQPRNSKFSRKSAS